MASVSTNRILAERALQETCGQQCVDWAVGMLEQGADSHFVLRLAGMVPPHNHFEIAELTDKALDELGIDDMPQDQAVTKYSVELLRSALRGDTDILTVIAQVKELCIATDYQRDIMDFYLLYFACSDLREYGYQYYWDGATSENIHSIMQERAAAFVTKSQTLN